MANRKVLINRHTSGSSAPIADSMYLGEIAVAHETGKETLFTKNNANKMVPFISCGQTISIINGKIEAANVTYDVKAKTDDAHVEVSASGDKAKVFTVSSKDVQSKTEFEAYSSKTTNALTALTQSFSELLDVTLTAGTGDDIITVSTAGTDASANTFNVKHAEAPAAITGGFNKLATDKYGHVTASTAVITADIQALGFKTSAQTSEDLKTLSASVATNETNIGALSGGILQLSADTHNKIVSVYNSAASYADSAVATAIEGLDSESATTSSRHYITAITFENGKIKSIGEGTDPKLSVKKNGEGNVVASIDVNDHEVTYETVNVATSGQIAELSGAVQSFSAETVSEFNSAFTAINNLSADTVAYVKSVSGNIESVINAMDKTASAADGQVVTTVSEANGVVSETKANVKDLQLGGYSKDTSATGSITATDTINAALSKLENIIAANEISNKDGSIVVTEPTGTATTTDVKVNIKSGEKVIKLDENGLGLYTNLDLVKITDTESLPATVKERYEFRDSNGNKIGESIDIAKDSHIVSIRYDESAQTLIYTYMDVEGTEKTVDVNMAHLVLESEVENGIQSNSGKLSIKLDTTGVDTGNGKFLSVGENGLKLDGVSDAIKAAVDALDVTDAAVNGQYVSSVSETDGKILVSRADISKAPLNEYAKGTDATAVAAADTVNQAISKLENQIDKAKAAATTKVVEGTDEGNNMTITSAAGADNSVTYTVSLTDVASKAALDAEIAARKAVDGQDGQTYAKNTSANYIADASSLNDADVKLDAAIKAEETARTSQDDKIEASIGLAADGSHVGTNGTYTSSATTVVGEIAALDKALKEVSDVVDGLDYSGLTNENTKVVTDVKQQNGLVSANATAVGDLVITAITASDVKVAANDSLATIAGKLQGQIDAMDSTAETSGNGYFLTSIKIEDGKITAAAQSNKADSASTADKVVNTLTMSDATKANSQTFDGSVARSLTFGTSVTADSLTGRSSMSMDANGVVDVEIIDCGEY